MARMAPDASLRALWLAVLQQAVKDAQADADAAWLRSRDCRLVCHLAGLDGGFARAWAHRLADHVEHVASDRRAAA
jgi:hypothetical protein